MATTKVDAKIELIRVRIQTEIERLEGAELESDKVYRGARANGLRFALHVIKEVEERVK